MEKQNLGNRTTTIEKFKTTKLSKKIVEHIIGWKHFKETYYQRFSVLPHIGLVVSVLDSQSRGPRFKATKWFQGWVSLSSFQGQPNEYQELQEI